MKFKIPLKIANTTDNAEMTHVWKDVVNSCKIEEGDILLFDFHPVRHGGLYLLIVCLHMEDNDSMSDGFSSANDSTDDEESLNMTEDEDMTEEDHRDKIWMRGMSSLISKSSFTLQNALA